MGAVVSEYVHATPAPALRRHVVAYSGYRDAGGPPAVHLGLPSPHLTFIVTLDDDLLMPAGDGRARFSTLVAGLDTAPATIVHDGRQSGIQISLHPSGARALFGTTAVELGPSGRPATDVAPWVDELQDRVRHATSWARRFDAVDLVLGRVLQPVPLEPALVAAWHALCSGRWSVGELADRIGWGPRRLSREFTAEFGVGPKTAARLARFDRARRDLLHTPSVPLLADLAARHGYYDQAHLAREFRAFAGVPPRTLLAAERRFVQADDGDTAADSRP